LLGMSGFDPGTPESAAMLAHAFSHDGAAYEVSFSRMDGQWFATVSRPGYASGRALPAYGDDSLGSFSDQAIRAGYIGLAEWLVRTGDWSDAAESCALPEQPARAPIAREKAAPQINRSGQELIGRELQALYADLLDEPVPDALLALLGSGAAATEPPAAQP
jgi:hypothetical protein